MNLFNSIYSNKKVLITGNTGFKGSWLALWLLELGAIVEGISQEGFENDIHFKELNLDYRTHYIDINNTKEIEDAVGEFKPDIIFHLAAQSLVRKSYTNPVETYSTNVIGTLNILEAARKSTNVKAFINVTTDKVYENIEADHAYDEDDELGGYDLYSSSKACSEILSASYRRSFLESKNPIQLATARAGNVIGGGDYSQDRLVPDIVKATINSQAVDIRNPLSIR
ncbi:MAG: CDP-glucose 4,6-dehydratase, partial [Crocinitomicaceae bacterium]|nr:CDP-glucose 4,6-dehydratase [Crocinitomicaceae bacterium]